MLDWIGSLRLRESSTTRVVLSLSHATQVTGAVLVVGGAYLAYAIWPLSPWLLVIPAALCVFGLLLITLHRRLIFDREAGMLQMEQGVMGMRSRVGVPLFHLRAVVIMARGEAGPTLPLVAQSRYLAYLDRRVGEVIYLDESRRCDDLRPMAEAIAEVAELRLEYDIASHVAGT